MEIREFQKKYINFLNKEVEKYCNKNGFLKENYKDTVPLTPDMLLEAIEDCKSELFDCIENSIVTQIIFEHNLENNCNFEAKFLDNIEKDIHKADFFTPEFEEWYEINHNLYLDLYEFTKYKGIELNIKKLIKNFSFDLNLIIATENEVKNSGNSIINSYGSNCSVSTFELEDFDNSITFLIHQQGHSIQEYFENLGNISVQSNSFIDSIISETMNNYSEYSSFLVFPVHFEGEKGIKFLNDILDKNNICNLKISKDSSFGLFSFFENTASMLNINLEKDFIVPKEMITQVFVENADNEYLTVGQITEFDNNYFKKNTIEITDEEIVLPRENMSKAIEKVKKMYV